MMLDVLRVSDTHRVDWPFAGLWSFIAFVSVHDGYLAVLLRSQLRDHEVNPLGQWLLQLGGGVWLLVVTKGVGTVLACAIMLLLFRMNRRLAWCAVLALAALQLCLLVYLSVSWLDVRIYLSLTV
jgi:hypothetical protein